MLLRPNETVLDGVLRSVRPAVDGKGFEVTLSVTANCTPTPEQDFLRPPPGSELTLFAAQSPDAAVGDSCNVKASLLGGPFGQRAVLSTLKKLD